MTDKTSSVEQDPPSLDITLDELRHRFALEESRKDSIENKTSLILATNAIIVTLIVSLLDLQIAIQVVVLIPAIVAIYLSLLIVEMRQYSVPGIKTEDFYQYAHLERNQLYDKFVISYIEGIEDNKSINEEKLGYFFDAYYLTILTIVLVILSPLLTWIVNLLF